jgi:hypothetical protein
MSVLSLDLKNSLPVYATLKAIMLIEIWERLRGYDKWVPAEAKVFSAEQFYKIHGVEYKVSPANQFSGDLLVWKDNEGEPHFGPFVTHETSPLYQLLEGESIAICYNPAKPDHCYCRPYFTSLVVLIIKAILGVVVFGGFFVWRIWMIIKHRGL